MTPRLQIQLNFGSIAGLAGFGTFLLYHFLGFNPLGNISWLTFWLPYVIVYFGTKKYREEELEGYISFGQAYGYSLFTIMIFATLYGMLSYLFGMFIDGTILDKYIAEAMEGIAKMEQLESLIGEETIELAAKEIQQTTMASISLSDVANKMIGGLLIAVIIALAIRKDKPVFDE